VQVSATKHEVGKLSAVNDDGSATVTTSGGFDIRVNQAQVTRVFLVILDLNGVLFHRPRKAEIVSRPLLNEFFQYLFKNFVVGVWSSCEEHNGKALVEEVFQQYQRRLVFQWFRSECTPNKTAENPYGTTKNLLNVWRQFPTSFNVDNTIIVDDSPEKCSHPQNALCPPTFDATSDALNDTGLAMVMDALKGVVASNSIEPVRVAMSATIRRPDAVRCENLESEMRYSHGGAAAGTTFSARTPLHRAPTAL